MNYCTKCGAKIGEGKQFCSKCGTPVMGNPTYNEVANRQNNTKDFSHEKQSFQETAGDFAKASLGAVGKGASVLGRFFQGAGTLICGILAILLSCIACIFPFPLDFIVIILAILGIVFGNKYRKTGSGMATAGMIVSIIALVIMCIGIILWMMAMP